MGAFPRQANPDSIAAPVDPTPPAHDSARLDARLQRRLPDTLRPATPLALSPDSLVSMPLEAASVEEMPETAVADTADMNTATPDSIVSPISRHSYVADTMRRNRLSRNRITAPEKTSKIVRAKVDLDNPVDFSAQDSMVVVGRSNAYMYGLSLIHIYEPTRP